jgi:hypothetical protein
LEVSPSGIEAGAELLEFLLRDDINLECEVGLVGFVAVDCGRKLGSDETVNVELNPGEVSSFRGGIFSQVESFLDKEFSLLFAGELPTLSEPRIFGFPPKELAIGRKLWVSFEEPIGAASRSTD